MNKFDLAAGNEIEHVTNSVVAQCKGEKHFYVGFSHDNRGFEILAIIEVNSMYATVFGPAWTASELRPICKLLNEHQTWGCYQSNPIKPDRFRLIGADE